MTSKHNCKIPREIRFWDCVDKKGDVECWELKAGTNKAGYGKIHYKK